MNTLLNKKSTITKSWRDKGFTQLDSSIPTSVPYSHLILSGSIQHPQMTRDSSNLIPWYPHQSLIWYRPVYSNILNISPTYQTCHVNISKWNIARLYSRWLRLKIHFLYQRIWKPKFYRTSQAAGQFNITRYYLIKILIQ